MNAIITNNMDAIHRLCQQHHVKELYVFGSSARDDFNSSTSDIDFLYAFDYSGFNFKLHPKDWPFSPFDDFFDLKFSLEKLLQKQVDLISYDDIENKYFKASIEKEKILIYGEEKPERVPARYN